MSGDVRIGDIEYTTRSYTVRADKKIVTCCGCGLPVDQGNPRCYVMNPDAYMGTYGPCCAPPDPERTRIEIARRQAAERRLRVAELESEAERLRGAADQLDRDAAALKAVEALDEETTR